jgi:signal transduction histidine kinase
MRDLRVLMVEDSEDDALLVTLQLRRGGYNPVLLRVESPEALRAALAQPWDVVISDYVLPRFDGREALRLVREIGGPELPFILVSGTIGEENAVDALKRGAGDFVTKQNLTRLVPAIEREMRDAQVRRERRATMEALREAVAARDQFLSIASHELRTPLTSLQLQVQSLQRTLYAGPGDTERMAARLMSVARSTERLGELVNRLLDVSRMTDGGPLELVREEFDLAELAEEVITRFRESFRDAEQRVHLDAPAPIRGRWDRMRLDTILSNLLSNAMKYGEGKPIDVRIWADGNTARLTVEDHGIGIASSDQARIFQRFERAVPQRHYGGFGIGLWVARMVAEAHGGHLAVDSKPGQGSTFLLDLPM